MIRRDQVENHFGTVREVIPITLANCLEMSVLPGGESEMQFRTYHTAKLEVRVRYCTEHPAVDRSPGLEDAIHLKARRSVLRLVYGEIVSDLENIIRSSVGGHEYADVCRLSYLEKGIAGIFAKIKQEIE